MVTFGILGMCLGTIPLGRLEWFARRWIFILPAYGIYRLCSYLLWLRSIRFNWSEPS